MEEIKNINPLSIEETEESKKKDVVVKFNEKNYLNVKLKDGKKKEMRIRLLPFDKNTGSPFKIIHMHNTKVDKQIAASGYKNYVCLRNTEDIDHEKYGNDCPFCELRREAYNKKNIAVTEQEKQIWEEVYRQNKVKEVCIVRCIERGAEEDGPKYWKFNLRSDGKDPKNEIINIYNNRKMESIEEEYGNRINGLNNQQINELCKKDGFEWFNVLDIYKGKDLKLVIEPVFENEKLTNKTNITITDYGKVQPITSDEKQLEEWLNDEKKWTDVFGVKDYNYLSIIIEGKIPFFDKMNHKWVAKEDMKTQFNEEKNSFDKTIEESKPKLEPIEQSTTDELPF